MFLALPVRPEGADFSNITVGAHGTDAGTYDAQFAEGAVGTVDKTEKYIVVSAEDGKLVIGKAKVTLKSADLSKAYDGTALENGGTALATETGLRRGRGRDVYVHGSQTLGRLFGQRVQLHAERGHQGRQLRHR